MTEEKRLLDTRWVVLLLIFGATMAPGLPVLWISQGFSRREKVVYSVLNLAWTVLLVWGFVRIMAWSWARISEAG